MESTTVLKALGLLESLATGGRAKSLAELAVELRMPKPTAHRLLKTLSITGYVEKGEPGVYRTGPALERLAVKGADETLRATAAPVLRELHRITRETVNLGVLRHGEIVYLDVRESPQSLRRVVAANSTDPFYCTALGRAIVSQLPEQQMDFLLSHARCEKRTPATVVDARRLRTILHEARVAGYAIEVDQTDVGVTCLAAPIFDARGVRGAVSLTSPSSRLDKIRAAKLLKLVRHGAARITKRLRSTSKRLTEE